ncbi:MAG: MerR family transcriptional regulator [Alphaproteobacteria bacterium]|nr:MerR family transcriptional regulator [Alphaproteobacteria bacterium]
MRWFAADGTMATLPMLPEVGAMVPDEPSPDALTIDELAAHTGVPSRTIRFYQSKGALQPPEIRGRKAYYHDTHVERLQLIGALQDRGLRIRAIRDLVARIDKGELVLSEWLGLEQRLQAPWADDEPRIYSDDELGELLGERRSGIVGDLVRLGFLERRGRSYLAPSPVLLEQALALEAAGVDLSVTRAANDLMARHVGRLADELVALYVKNAGDGFGASGSAGELAHAFDGLRPVGLAMIQHVFASEMQRVLTQMVASGAAAKVPRTRR